MSLDQLLLILLALQGIRSDDNPTGVNSLKIAATNAGTDVEKNLVNEAAEASSSTGKHDDSFKGTKEGSYGMESNKTKVIESADDGKIIEDRRAKKIRFTPENDGKKVEEEPENEKENKDVKEKIRFVSEENNVKKNEEDTIQTKKDNNKNDVKVGNSKEIVHSEGKTTTDKHLKGDKDERSKVLPKHDQPHKHDRYMEGHHDHHYGYNEHMLHDDDPFYDDHHPPPYDHLDDRYYGDKNRQYDDRDLPPVLNKRHQKGDLGRMAKGGPEYPYEHHDENLNHMETFHDGKPLDKTFKSTVTKNKTNSATMKSKEIKALKRKQINKARVKTPPISKGKAMKMGENKPKAAKKKPILPKKITQKKKAKMNRIRVNKTTIAKKNMNPSRNATGNLKKPKRQPNKKPKRKLKFKIKPQKVIKKKAKNLNKKKVTLGNNKNNKKIVQGRTLGKPNKKKNLVKMQAKKRGVKKALNRKLKTVKTKINKLKNTTKVVKNNPKKPAKKTTKPIKKVTMKGNKTKKKIPLHKHTFFNRPKAKPITNRRIPLHKHTVFSPHKLQKPRKIKLTPPKANLAKADRKQDETKALKNIKKQSKILPSLKKTLAGKRFENRKENLAISTDDEKKKSIQSLMDTFDSERIQMVYDIIKEFEKQDREDNQLNGDQKEKPLKRTFQNFQQKNTIDNSRDKYNDNYRNNRDNSYPREDYNRDHRDYSRGKRKPDENKRYNRDDHYNGDNNIRYDRDNDNRYNGDNSAQYNRDKNRNFAGLNKDLYNQQSQRARKKIKSYKRIYDGDL